jgi:ABC-type dipeptide/oligopeptide/nickel transport system permease component
VLSISLFWIFRFQLDIDIVFNQYYKYIPPILILGLFALCIIFKQTRTSILEEKNKDYVLLCYFKGLSKSRTFIYHIIPNILPTIGPTVLIVFGSLLEGSLFTESIFGINGLGSFLYAGIVYKKTEQLLLGMIVVSIIYVTMNSLSDYYARKNNIRYK